MFSKRDQNLEQEAAAGQDNINNDVNNNNEQVDEVAVANGHDSDGDDWTDAEFIEFWRQQVNPDFNQDDLNEMLQQFEVNNVNELMQLHPFFNNLDEEDNEHQEDVDGNEDSDSDDSGNEEVDINNDDDSDGESEE